MKLVWKLLRQHISVPQFAGFFFANLVGMLIVLLGVQFYIDTQSVYNGEDSFMKEDYLIVNKQIGAVTTITGKSNAFTKSEIKDLKNQDFVEKNSLLKFWVTTCPTSCGCTVPVTRLVNSKGRVPTRACLSILPSYRTFLSASSMI
ncbi:MAG: hypothetical protein IIT55_02440 [Bacteroidaceae bacterium]|nr:hypothetical protein [Bacteroidaceae bacterium]